MKTSDRLEKYLNEGLLNHHRKDDGPTNFTKDERLDSIPRPKQTPKFSKLEKQEYSVTRKGNIVHIILDIKQVQLLGNLLNDVVYGTGPSRDTHEKFIAKKLLDSIRTNL